MAALEALPTELIQCVCRNLPTWQDLRNLHLTNRVIHQKCLMRPRDLENTIKLICLRMMYSEQPLTEEHVAAKITRADHAHFILACLRALQAYYGYIPPNACRSALDFASKAAYTQDGIRVLEVMWELQTRKGCIPCAAVQPAMRLVDLYERVGQTGDAIVVLEKMYAYQIRNGIISTWAKHLAARRMSLCEGIDRTNEAQVDLDRLWKFGPSRP